MEDLRELRERLTEYVESITTKGRGRNKYICPLCKSGTGKHKTPAFSIMEDGIHWNCFSCSPQFPEGRQTGDIFDLIGFMENITTPGEQIKRARELFGIPGGQNQYKSSQKLKARQRTAEPMQEEQPVKKAEEPDYTDFFIEAHKHIKETDYPARRGLTEETVERFNLGYVRNWKNPANDKAPLSPRLIIPTSKHSYLARDTREPAPSGAEGFTKVKAGAVHFFNIEALTTAKKPIFITEGELNAISIIQEGGEAIALGSTAQARPFIDYLRRHKPCKTLILATDRDEAGDQALATLEGELQEIGIPYLKGQEVAGSYNDANEYLTKDREGFRRTVKELSSQERTEYLRESAGNSVLTFMDGIFLEADTPAVPTGFTILDRELDGGIYEGLYIIGSISSAGKTTIVLQMADQIASQGQDVIIFSLEMSQYELIAKSISRQTFKEVLDTEGDKRNAKTTRGITSRSRWNNYSDKETELIMEAISKYSQYAGNIFIKEGIGNIGVKEVTEAVERHIRITGNRPVVFIDYLQILAPHNERATDKQNTDKNVLELKRLSRDYKLPIVAISSFNRSNYRTEAAEEAFKESGAIEYSSDVLLALQFVKAGTEGFNVRKAKRRRERNMELVILKNRNAQAGSKIQYTFYTLFNYFKEEGLVEEYEEEGADFSEGWTKSESKFK